MAYMDQATKAKLSPRIKALCAKYRVKASISVNNRSTLIVNIKSGELDFIGNYNQCGGNNANFMPATGSLQVNPYWINDYYSGQVKDFLGELVNAMNDGNHDNSDIITDYFDVGWYSDINIGKWNAPYILEK